MCVPFDFVTDASTNVIVHKCVTWKTSRIANIFRFETTFLGTLILHLNMQFKYILESHKR